MEADVDPGPAEPVTVPVRRTAPEPPPRRRTQRSAEIVAAAARILSAEGPAALTMRRLAQDLGIRAPSLYKHLPSKEAVEAALVEDGLREMGARMHAAVDAAGPDRVVPELLSVYRAEAKSAPHRYRLATSGSLARDLLPAGLEDWAGEPFYRATGDPHVAQALWAAAHGMAVLEIDERFLGGSDLDRTWAALAAAFARR